jgi:zinc protease
MAVQSLDHHFRDSLNVSLWKHHPRSVNYSVEDIERITPARALAVIRDRFSDASGFTFTIVGSFHPDSLRPLVEQYLASLPALHRKERWVSNGVRYPDGIVRNTFKFGTSPRSRTAIVFNGAVPSNTDVDKPTLKVLGEILRERLRVRLREQTSGIGLSTSFVTYPVSQTLVTVEFGATPDRVNELSAAVVQETERLRIDGPTEDEVAFVKLELAREFEDIQNTNDYWMERLQSHAMSGKPFGKFTSTADPVANLRVETVRAYAKQYLNGKRYVQVTQIPHE